MKKILYAEDNAGMRKMVSHYLRSIGFEIVAITDGDEAIEIAKVEDFDLILLDVTMERIDGISAVRRQRKWAKLVLLITERLASFDVDIKLPFLGIASGDVAMF